MLDPLLAASGLRREGPADTQQVDAAETAIGAPLPKSYRDLLHAADGVSLLDGHLRLLGTDDLIRWNDPETWKHAWSPPPTDCICFGGSSVGDQWAWRLIDLQVGIDVAVVQLDGFELTEAPLAPTTTLFLTSVLPARATTQLDDLVALAHQRFGPLTRNTLLIAAPPAQFGVEGLVNRMIPLSDANVMTALGDIGRQLEVQPSRVVKRFETVTDDRGRVRIELIFD